MTKKIIKLLLVCSIVFLLTACGKNNADGTYLAYSKYGGYPYQFEISIKEGNVTQVVRNTFESEVKKYKGKLDSKENKIIWDNDAISTYSVSSDKSVLTITNDDDDEIYRIMFNDDKDLYHKKGSDEEKQNTNEWNNR